MSVAAQLRDFAHLACGPGLAKCHGMSTMSSAHQTIIGISPNAYTPVMPEVAEALDTTPTVPRAVDMTPTLPRVGATRVGLGPGGSASYAPFAALPPAAIMPTLAPATVTLVDAVDLPLSRPPFFAIAVASIGVVLWFVMAVLVLGA
jgi:hypothetical protein